MQGVKYLYNAKGKRTAVLIDLERSAAVGEELLDVAVARIRERSRPKAGRRFAVTWSAPDG